MPTQSPGAQAAAPERIGLAVPDQLTPIMPLERVRTGMKGYGLTVFHGTEPEPFPVEVLSVVTGATPGRSVIWIVCDDPRLDESGPVQGMSGSPIYLWPLGEEKKPGQGGLLIGAFAFGHSYVKECLAGVQPIQYMRELAETVQRPDGQDTQADAEQSQANGGSPGQSLRMMTRLARVAEARSAWATNRFRLDATLAMMRQVWRRHGLSLTAASDPDAALPVSPRAMARSAAGRVTRMMLPLNVGSADAAQLLAPLLKPLGVLPVAGGGSGPPPPSPPAAAPAPHVGVGDPRTAQTILQPGSVLAIPLASGDMDLSAAGTVTDILPDGTVLGFGHPMFGQGQTALPMATGYVHFFVPRLSISFKQTASLRTVGSIVQDRKAGIAGIDTRTFTTAPVDIHVRMADLPVRDYHYQVVNHPLLTPTIAGILAMQSLTAIQDLPIENTLYLEGQLAFTGGRTLEIDSMLAGARPQAMMFELLPIISAMTHNPHENLELESMQITTRVEPVLRVGSLINARLDQAQVAPGDEIVITATVRPYNQPPQTYHARLRVPANLEEGDYPLLLLDAASYAMMSMANRPHLMATTSVDDIAELLQEMLSIQSNALYVVLQLPERGVAVGRTEMPRLPSSRRAMIATPTSTLAVAYVETAEQMIPTDVVVHGQQAFTISVRKEITAELQPPPEEE